MVIFDDEQIGRLIHMPKTRTGTRTKWPSLRSKRGHFEAHISYGGAGQRAFRVVLLKSIFNSLAFSAVLMVRVPNSTRSFRLRRYNGNNHEHFNLVERDRFRTFHIHTATERYQLRGGSEDGYAEPTERFSSYEEAIRCLAEDAALQPPPDFDPVQLSLPFGAEE